MNFKLFKRFRSLIHSRIDKNFKSGLRSYIPASLVAAMILTGCGSDYEGGLRTGPTITPAPSKATDAEATEDFSLDMTDEEILAVLEGVKERALNQSMEYDFEITDEMTAEKSEHSDGESEVYVYDSDDNLIAVLVYQNHVIERADIDNYEDGSLKSGCVYIDGSLLTYYETADLNGSFRVEVSYEDGTPSIYSVTTGVNKTRDFEVD